MSDIREGQILGGRYRILHLIGEGGFGEVWKATDQTLGRQVALKIIGGQKLELNDPEQNKEIIERFKREARILANLKHIHILSLFDYGQSDKLRYLVMPLHEGGTLAERIKRKVLPLNEIDHYFSQLASALDYAHSEKIIHRDLKPSNALIDQHQNILLTDFGISKLVEDSVELTVSGTTLGTPDYMSPEQFKGLSADHRSDIYSLGAILYQMLVGHPPFEAENKWAVAQKHINEFAPRPSTLRHEWTPEIDDVVMKALAKDPAERFNSAAEMLVAWKMAIGQPDVARSVAPTAMMNLSTMNVHSDTARNIFTAPRVAALGGVAIALAAILTCGVVMVAGWGIFNVFTPNNALPKLSGNAAANGITVLAESAIGSKSIKVTFENKNPINYAAQISASNGQAKAVVLKQPSGFKFPLNPEKDFLTLKPNQKETTTLNFDVLINANDALILQWIAADVGGTVNLTVNLVSPR